MKPMEVLKFNGERIFLKFSYSLVLFKLFWSECLPIQILGMIEEAAGTRMYEAKKQSALRTIEKKEGKMAEIKQVWNSFSLIWCSFSDF